MLVYIFRGVSGGGQRRVGEERREKREERRDKVSEKVFSNNSTSKSYLQQRAERSSSCLRYE